MVEAPEGFAEFVAARSPALLMTARFLTDDHARAEDLVQEALARSWRCWDRIERQDRPEVYVRKVMVNLSTSWWRRRWRAEVPTDVLPELPEAGDVMGEVEAREAVRSALAVLPARQRAVVVLRYLDDLTEAQTAAVLGCSVGTVKSHCARALVRLRDSHALTDFRELAVASSLREEAGAGLSADVVAQAGRERLRQTRIRVGVGAASLLVVATMLIRRLIPAGSGGDPGVVVGRGAWWPGLPSGAGLGYVHLWRYVAESGVLVGVAAATVGLALLSGRTPPRSWQRQVVGAWSWLLAGTGAILVGTRVGGRLREVVEVGLQGEAAFNRFQDVWWQGLLGLVVAGAGVAARQLPGTGRRLPRTSVAAEVTLLVGAAIAGDSLWELLWVIAGVATQPWDGGFPVWVHVVGGLTVVTAGVFLALVAGPRGTAGLGGRIVSACGMAAAWAAVPPGSRAAQMAVWAWRGREIGQTPAFWVLLGMCALGVAAAAAVALSPGRWWVAGRRIGIVAGASTALSLASSYLLAAAVGQTASDQWLSIGGGFLLPYTDLGASPHGGVQANVVLAAGFVVILGMTARLVSAGIDDLLHGPSAQSDVGEPEPAEHEAADDPSEGSDPPSAVSSVEPAPARTPAGR